MSERPGPALLEWLRSREEAMVGLLRRLAAAESPTASQAAQEAALEILAAELGEAGYRVRRVRTAEGDRHLYALPSGRGRGRPRQLLVGHVDTVWPAGTLERMPVRMDDGLLRGPGVYDMKGGLTQLVFALRALRELGVEPPADPVVFVNSDEERGSSSSSRYLELLARGAARAFILEPSSGPDGKLKTGRKGVGRFRLAVRGKASHAGADPEAGASAILELSHQVQRLFDLNDPERGVTVNVGTIDGGLRPNVVAPEASAVVDVRVLTREDAAAVERAIRGTRPVEGGVSLSISGGFGRPPLQPTPRNRDLWRSAQQAAAELGLDIGQVTDVGGASDGNLTSLYTATLDGLGAVGDGAHAAHEHVEVGRMPERAALLALLLASPLAGEPRALTLAEAGAEPSVESVAGAIHTSVTRVGELERKPLSRVGLPREDWRTGDYVVGELLNGPFDIETASGRTVEALQGDFLVGALGRRFATLQVTGDWEGIGDDLLMDGLTRSGVFGKTTSVAPPSARFVASLRYRGHVLVKGRRAGTKTFVEGEPERVFAIPTILVVGTSMEAGKTTAAKRIIRALRQRNLRVGGVKLTGVARYRDILGMRDAGADVVLDFVDAGLASTICPEAEFRAATRSLLSRLAGFDLDVVVAEAGASPLEPYNGEAAIEELDRAIACTVLCALDPYAVVGVVDAFGGRPDFVSGRATATLAGTALIRKLTGLPALNVLDPATWPELDAILAERLALHGGEAGQPSEPSDRDPVVG